MDKTVIVAFIAGTASLIVAITSLIATLINSRNTSRTSEAIERLKNEFSQSNRALDILDSETKANLQSLKESIQAIQQLRDAIKIFKYDKETAVATGILERIYGAAENIIANYSESQATLSEIEKSRLHSTKNLAIFAQLAVQQFKVKSKNHKKSDLLKGVSENFNDFDELQIHLSENQRILWDCRTERILGLSKDSLVINNNGKKENSVG